MTLGSDGNNVAVLGIDCVASDLASVVDRVLELVADRKGGYVSTCNVHVVVSASRDASYTSALSEAALRVPDGWPVAWMQRRQGAAWAERIPGPDLMGLTLDRGRTVNLGHFLLGSTESVLQDLERQLPAAYPGLRIVGTYSPPFGPDSYELDGDVAEFISRVKPDIVWVGLGAPKQDLWMQAHRGTLSPAVLVGVGAAFDFLSGERPRAPRWMQNASLEWCHRLVSEPRRLTRRYVSTNTAFIVKAGSQLLRRARGLQ